MALDPKPQAPVGWLLWGVFGAALLGQGGLHLYHAAAQGLREVELTWLIGIHEALPGSSILGVLGSTPVDYGLQRLLVAGCCLLASVLLGLLGWRRHGPAVGVGMIALFGWLPATVCEGAICQADGPRVLGQALLLLALLGRWRGSLLAWVLGLGGLALLIGVPGDPAAATGGPWTFAAAVLGRASIPLLCLVGLACLSPGRRLIGLLLLLPLAGALGAGSDWVLVGLPLLVTLAGEGLAWLLRGRADRGLWLLLLGGWHLWFCAARHDDPLGRFNALLGGRPDVVLRPLGLSPAQQPLFHTSHQQALADGRAVGRLGPGSGPQLGLRALQLAWLPRPHWSDGLQVLRRSGSYHIFDVRLSELSAAGRESALLAAHRIDEVSGHAELRALLDAKDQRRLEGGTLSELERQRLIDLWIDLGQFERAYHLSRAGEAARLFCLAGQRVAVPLKRELRRTTELALSEEFWREAAACAMECFNGTISLEPRYRRGVIRYEPLRRRWDRVRVFHEFVRRELRR